MTTHGGTVPPLREGVCPCCGYSGKPSQRACARDETLCRRCRPENCPHESGCPGPFRGQDPQLDLLAG